jgi:MFS family permease
MPQGIPRPFFFVVASFAGALAHGLLAGARKEITFVIGVTLSGFAFGMVWPLMVLVVGDMFGTANVGANYLLYDGVSSAVGTLLLSKFITGKVYESHIIPDSDESDNRTCLGKGCFQSSHLIVAGLSLSCLFTSLCLLYAKLTRQVYSRRQ